MEHESTNTPTSTEQAVEEKSERFNTIVTILILLTTVWTAYIAYIQSVDGDRQGDGARDSQVAAINALTAYSAAIQQNSYDAKLLARYDELTLQANASSTSADDYSAAGDTFNARQSRAAAERLMKARDVIKSFSPAFTDTKILDEDQRPNLALRAPELFEPAYRAEETQIVLSKQSSAVAIKSNLYVLIITLAAVTLFLLGLSLTVESTFVRILFVGLGSVIVAGSVVWFCIARGAPEPSLTGEAIASFAQGRVAYEQGNLDQAIQAFSTAIDKAGGPTGYARAYYWRGQVQVEKEDYSAALADFSKAIELEPDADLYGARGWVYIDSQDYAKAESDFKHAVELSPESDDDINSLGWAQFLAGNYSAAQENFRKAIKLNAKYPVYQFNLGAALLATGDLANARTAYEAGMQLTQNKPVELVGWQLESAIDALETPHLAPSASNSEEFSKTVQDLLAQTRTNLAQAGAIDNIVFSSGVEGDQPVDKLTVFEPGTKEVYVFLDFTNMADGALWGDTWYINGELVPELSTERAEWNAGNEGMTYLALSTDDAGLIPGEYKVEIRIGDELMKTASFRVRPTDAAFGEIVFARDFDAQDQPVDPSFTFETGIKEVKAAFDFSNMTDNVKWSALWWLDDQEIDTSTANAPIWTLGTDGSTFVSLASDEALPAGEYTLVLLVEGDVFQEGQFKIIEPSDLIGDIVFAPAVDGDGMPISATETFASGTQVVYATFEYSGIAANQAFSAVWYQDGKEISRSEETWRGTESGHSWVMLGNKEGLVAGQYDLELSVDGKVVQTGVMVIEGGE